MCFLAAFLYGCYTTLIQKGLPDDGHSQVCIVLLCSERCFLCSPSATACRNAQQPGLFFGFLGLFNSVIFGFGLILFYYMQWEVRTSLSPVQL